MRGSTCLPDGEAELVVLPAVRRCDSVSATRAGIRTGTTWGPRPEPLAAGGRPRVDRQDRCCVVHWPSIHQEFTL